jgi:arylsulfatase A-like enzyme
MHRRPDWRSYSVTSPKVVTKGQRRAGVAAAAAILAAGGLVLWRAPRGRPDVLLLTIDTLRADRLGCYGSTTGSSPRIDALAASGLVFDNAACPMPLTRPSHFSMMTGLYPRQHGVLNNQGTLADPVPTVAEAFAGAGYRTAAFVGVRLLAADSGAGQGFEVLEAPPGASWTADEVGRRAIDWVAQAPAAREPFFLWVHLFDPHMPYAPPAGFAPAAPAAGADALPEVSWRRLVELAGRDDGRLSRQTLDRALALYDGEVAFTDHWVGRVLDALDGRRDRQTAVVFTADHGECFDHGIYFEHSDCLYDGAVKVPLILRGAGSNGRGERRARQVENLDLAGTLLDLAGLPRPATFTRPSLLADGTGADGHAFFQHPLYAEHSAQNRVKRQEQIRSVAGEATRPLRPGQDELGVRTERWKYIRSGAGEELYDLAADPGERANRAADEAVVRERMKEAVAAWTRAHPLNLAAEGPINERLRETLRSLGYLQ